MGLVNRTACPVCEQGMFDPYLTTRDFSVSGEEFSIVRCRACGFHFTNPVPAADEIGRYYKSENYVSHSSTKRGIINRLYHVVRKYTLKKKVKLVNRLSGGRELLDIGSGTGHFLNQAKLARWSVTGLEPDDDARSLGNREFGLTIQPLEQLHKLNDGAYDVITLWHVLEHVYDLKRDVSKMISLLNDQGTLVIAVPNMNSFDASVYKEFWAAYDLPIHLYHFVKTDIEHLFAPFGLELVEMVPMKFDSFYVSMLSEKYRGGSIFRAFFVGLRSNWKAKGENYSSMIYILRRKSQ